MTMSLLCDENSVLLLRQYVKKLTEFLSLYTWIIDAYVSDFFTKDHWSGLPLSWKDCLTDTEPPELVWLLTQDRTIPDIKKDSEPFGLAI